MPDFFGGRNSFMWSACCQSFAKNWSLFVKEGDPCLTPKDMHYALHWPLDSFVSPYLSSDLASSPPSTTNYSFASPVVPLTPWKLWLCPSLLSYQLLITCGRNTNNQQPNSLGLSPSLSFYAPNAWTSISVAWYIFASYLYYSLNTLEYGVIRFIEEGKDEKVYMMN